MVGPDRGGEQIAEILARRERGQAGRFRANTVKIMQDGVAENFTAGMLEPYLRLQRLPDHGSGLSYVDPAALRELRDRSWTRSASRCTSTRSATARCGRPGRDRGRPGRATARTTDRHHIAHLQVVHPDDVPRFAALDVTAQHAGAVGRARAADGRADDPVHRAGAGRRGSMSFGDLLRGRRAAGRRQRLGGQQRQPAARDPRRGEPVAARSDRRRRRAVPARSEPRTWPRRSPPTRSARRT